MQATETKAVSSTNSRSWEACLLIFLVISTVCILGWLLTYSHHGLEFSDEGYYLVWISNPFNYDWSTTQFGFIYHPLYLLLDGNIARLRQANILIVFFLTWLLVDALFRKSSLDASRAVSQRLVLSSGFAIVSLTYFTNWLPTPSYNSLGLQAMLITALGLVSAKATRTSSSIIGWVLIGLGGGLAFMAKPPLAAALGGCAIIYMLLSRKFNFFLASIAMGVALALLVLSALIIDGSIYSFVARLRVGAELSALVGAGYSLQQIFRIDEFNLNDREALFIGFLTAASFCAAYFTCATHFLLRTVGIALSIVFLIICVITILGVSVYNIGGGAFKGLIIWAIPFGIVLLCLTSFLSVPHFKINIGQCVLSLTLVAFPHVFAFGTNGNYWQVGSYVGIFWLLSGLALIAPSISDNNMRKAFFPLALAAQVITVLLLQTGLENPYRQTQALRLSNHAVEIGRPGSLLLLSDGYANYVNEAITFANKGGLEPGTPIIDLTGQSPTLIYALRAISVGYPWIAGGYPGSLEVARLGLRRVPCVKLAPAWLLLEPDGPRALPGDLLKSFGGALPEHYQVVASWYTAEGAGSFQVRRHQQLLRPLRSESEATQACEIIRAGT